MENKKNTNSRFLFKGFLENEKTYNRCEGYWKRYINQIIGDQIAECNFFKNAYGNGLKVYDANPILFFIFKDKATRIILSSETEYEYEYRKYPNYNLTAYWDNYSYNENEYKELVLSLFMCPSAVAKAKSLLKEWLTSEGYRIELTGDPVRHEIPDVERPVYRSIACNVSDKQPKKNNEGFRRLKKDVSNNQKEKESKKKKK